MSDKWEGRFLGMAELVGGWSKDPSTRVGAVIADRFNRVVSLGYNGPPRGVEDDPGICRDKKLLRTIHAEQNAILFAARPLQGATIYVTRHPCARCAAFIAQAGLSRVVYREDRNFEARWADDVAEARAILREEWGDQVMTRLIEVPA